jgi:hypothetical protein
MVRGGRSRPPPHGDGGIHYCIGAALVARFPQLERWRLPIGEIVAYSPTVLVRLPGWLVYQKRDVDHAFR